MKGWVTVELQVDENLSLLSFRDKESQSNRQESSHSACLIHTVCVCVCVLFEHMLSYTRQRSTTGALCQQRSDGLSQGQDDPEPPDNVGLEVRQKVNFSVCHSQQFYHTLRAALESQSRLTN